MDNPTNQDIFNAISKLIGILNQLIKQVEDLQDVVGEQNHQIGIQQDTLDKLTQAKIHLASVFIIKKDKYTFPKLHPIPHPDIKINKPAQKKDIIFWLPNSADCNSKGARN